MLVVCSAAVRSVPTIVDSEPSCSEISSRFVCVAFFKSNATTHTREMTVLLTGVVVRRS
jgi:hypothetical protein